MDYIKYYPDWLIIDNTFKPNEKWTIQEFFDWVKDPDTDDARLRNVTRVNIIGRYYYSDL